jgi:alpha-galactosidase
MFRHLMWRDIVLVLPMLFTAKPAAALEFRTGAASIRLENGAPQWWTYQAPSGRTIPFAGPVIEIDGQPADGPLADLREAGPPRTLASGVREFQAEGRFARQPSLRVRLVFRLPPDNPVVRFRYEVYSTAGQKLTRATGRDRLEYGSLSLDAFPIAREVRFSEFQEFTHSFTLSEREIESREFANRLRLMGPLLAASDGRESILVAYEHGSQVPDAFLEYQLGPDRGVHLRAVKGNYWGGQSMTADVPWRSVWMHAAVAAGTIDDLAATYRTFLLRYQSEAAASRTPYIFYNTWNFQERNKWWNGKPYLESMNEARILQEIDVAHAMGIDVFVLDTGWYEKTGDWEVSGKRFPHGLAPIRARLDQYGMKLGLWFNPTASALTSRMYLEQRAAVMSRNGREGQPSEIWETEASQTMCLVSRYSDAFADKIIQVAKETGARYFKWDAIGQYGCDSGSHDHGSPSTPPAERAASYAFLLPRYMAAIVEKVSAAVPDAIVDFDITEGGRAVGLSFLSAGKYFLINNGPYKFNYDLPMNRSTENWNLFFYPGPARTWICRRPLTFDKWIPSVLFLTHYFPDDPLSSQTVNLASLVLGQNGIWGDLPAISKAGVNFWHEGLRHYKQVRDDITVSSPARSGAVGGTPEIHEKISPAGWGAVVVFATSGGEFTYVTRAPVVRQFWQTGGAEVEFDPDGRARIQARLDKPGAVVLFFGAGQ